MKKDICFDFSIAVERRNTASMKWDKYKGRDIIPLWVADMDFCSPPVITEALHQRIDHGVFGYTIAPESLKNVVAERLQTDYGWAGVPAFSDRACKFPTQHHQSTPCGKRQSLDL